MDNQRWPCLKGEGDTVTLQVSVRPRARVARIIGLLGNRLKVSLAAPPTDGRANQELISLLAEVFGVPLRALALEQGHTSRNKTLSIQGVNRKKASAVLDELLKRV